MNMRTIPNFARSREPLFHWEPDHVRGAISNAVSGAFRGAGAWLARTFRLWRQDRQAAKSLDTLMDLSDHLLDDIGVSRADIERAHDASWLNRRRGR